jgi:hypothetical protein
VTISGVRVHADRHPTSEEDMIAKKFLESGSGVQTHAVIAKNNQNVKITNLDAMLLEMIPNGTLGRIHSRNSRGIYTVWLLDEATYSTLIVEVPQHMMGSLFTPKDHGLFPHFR